jgi:hypothetical protein
MLEKCESLESGVWSLVQKIQKMTFFICNKKFRLIGGSDEGRRPRWPVWDVRLKFVRQFFGNPYDFLSCTQPPGPLHSSTSDVLNLF